MIRILHTADWHLGKKLERFSRFQEQVDVMNEICEIADKAKADVIIIAGDIFDHFNPPTEAIELLYKTLKRLSNNGTRPIVAIAGNHDSPAIIESTDPLARSLGIFMVGYPHTQIKPITLDTGVAITQSDHGFVELSLPQCPFPIRMILTPYANERRLRKYLGVDDTETELRESLSKQWEFLAEKYCDQNGVNILMAHLFFAKRGTQVPEEPYDEKPIIHVGGAQIIYSDSVPDAIQYTALGHLHRKQLIDKEASPMVYSSSPLAYSFSEQNQQKYVILIEAEPQKPVSIRDIPIRSGRRLKKASFPNTNRALEWLQSNLDDYVELEIATDDFITQTERRSIMTTHPRIVNLIPKVKNLSMHSHSQNLKMNLSQDINKLFAQYFEHKHGHVPNDELRSLFKELLTW